MDMQEGRVCIQKAWEKIYIYAHTHLCMIVFIYINVCETYLVQTTVHNRVLQWLMQKNGGTWTCERECTIKGRCIKWRGEHVGMTLSGRLAGSDCEPKAVLPNCVISAPIRCKASEPDHYKGSGGGILPPTKFGKNGAFYNIFSIMYSIVFIFKA